VALAEENGLVHDLGMLVMRRACAEAARWPNPLDIAVNLSPLQFQQGDLPEQILSILVESGLPPSRFELEITATVLITDFDRAVSRPWACASPWTISAPAGRRWRHCSHSRSTR